jgi:hypothetical protein
MIGMKKNLSIDFADSGLKTLSEVQEILKYDGYE